jgi:hypothetical protein
VTNKKPTGGARPRAGRPKAFRRVLSFRVDESLYARVAELAKIRETSISDLAEEMFIKGAKGILKQAQKEGVPEPGQP